MASHKQLLLVVNLIKSLVLFQHAQLIVVNHDAVIEVDITSIVGIGRLKRTANDTDDQEPKRNEEEFHALILKPGSKMKRGFRPDH